MEKKESIPMIGDTIKKQIMDFINENELPIENLHMKVSNNKYIFGMAIPGNEKIDKVFKNPYKRKLLSF